MPRSSSQPRKGKRFWTVRMDLTGLYEAAPAVFVQADRHGTRFYRVTFEHEGERDTVVIDIEDRDVFATEREAIVAAALRCRSAAERWTRRADELLARLI